MNIKGTIKKYGYTSIQVAEQLGITKGAMSQMVRAESVSTKTLQKIADVIGCKVGDFFADETSPSDFCALVKSGDKCYQASTLDELKVIVATLEGK